MKKIGRYIRKEAVVSALVHEIWDAWTTNDGVRKFFAPDSNVDLRIGGPYEIFFVPDAPKGQRGGEDLCILSYLPCEMLSFEWNNPPVLEEIRNEKTWVVVQLGDAGDGSSRVCLSHLGWKKGEIWDKAFDYFTKAWDVVLGRLKESFETGPVDWSSP